MAGFLCRFWSSALYKPRQKASFLPASRKKRNKSDAKQRKLRKKKKANPSRVNSNEVIVVPFT